MGRPKFSDSLNSLVALITYLGCTDFQSRRAEPLAKDLGIPFNEVQKTLEGFPTFFRRSRNPKQGTNEHYWTLHIRYALRPVTDSDDAKGPPLAPSELVPLLEIVTTMVAQERESDRHGKDLEQGRIKANYTLGASFVAAFAAIVAAWLSV